MKHLTSSLSLLVLLALLVPQSRAQEQGRPGGRAAAMAIGQISGTVRDLDAGDPIPSATVAIWYARDSTLATGAITGDDGRFSIEGIRPGRYYVKVSFIGFRTETVDRVAVTPQNPRVDLGDIRLTADTAQLDEVQITADRDFMEVRIDKTVYNTRDQLVSTGGSATDVLRNIPSVEVDMDGKVSLRGSQNVAVLINGRPAQMNGDMLASFLQGLPSSTVDRVEVIPNPSARYEPDGMSGILNIVLKQDVDRGVSGSFTGGVGTQEDFNLSGMLAYGRGALNTRVNYGFRRGIRASSGERLNEYRFRQPLDYLEAISTGARDMWSHSLNLNADYQLNKQNSIGVSAMLSTRSGDRNERSAYEALNASKTVYDRYDRVTEETSQSFNMDYTLSFKRVIQPAKHEFTAEARYGTDDDDQEKAFWQELLAPNPNPSIQGREINHQLQDNANGSVQLDYVRPLGEDTKLEAGYKGTLRRLGSDLSVETFSPSMNQYIPEPFYDNAFTYEERVHAGYGIIGAQLGALGLQAGARLEQANTTFDLETTGEAFDNGYFSVFPSAFVTYKFNDNYQLRGSYSKRINRPRTWFLNPLSDRDDPLFRREGNPYLKPEYVHSVEVGLSQTTRLGTLSLSPYYRRTVDVIRFINTVDPDGVTKLTFKNLDVNESWGAEAIGSIRLGDRFNGFGSFEVFRTTTDGSNVEAALTSDALGWSTRLNGTFKLMPTLDLQLSWFYRAPMDVEQGRIGSFSRSDIALRQQFLGRKASLSLRINDPLNTSGFNMWRDTPAFYLENARRWDSRSANLTFTYNFGQQDRNQNRRRMEDRGQQGGDESEMMGF